ncbi:MAG TPA: BolA/IbaG family iron-sulfur metabolism protein [Pseudomonadales bacterium]|nr:BolA/IbaG family iron-sulfur metabolism protein [Pseudomonadales bacterium]
MSEQINNWIEQVLKETLTADVVLVGGDGRHFDITVVSACFEGQRPVKKQQLVYAALNDKIADGTIHAVMMQTLTPSEWQAQA